MLTFYNIMMGEIIILPLVLNLFIWINFLFWTRTIRKYMVVTKTKVNSQITGYLGNLDHFKIYMYNYLKLLLSIWFIITNYFFAYEDNYYYSFFSISNNLWVIYLIYILFSIYSFFLFKKFFNFFSNKHIELYVLLITFYTSYIYIYLVNNFIFLLVIFEIQNIIFLYFYILTSILKTPKYTKFNSFSMTGTFNLLIYQFWIMFLGSIIFIFGCILLTCETTLLITEEIVMYSIFSVNKYIIFGWFCIIIGLNIKLGLVPYMFWKVELYKYLPNGILFIYMTFYWWSLALLVVYFYSHIFIYFIKIYYLYFLITILLGMLYIVVNFWIVSSIRMFFVLSSFIQIIYIFIPLVFSRNFYLSHLNIFFYILFCLHLFCILLYAPSILTGPLTNFWWWSRDYLLIISLITLLLNVGGIPPLVGFWSKFLILFNLLFVNEYVIFGWILIFSFTMIYFYLSLFQYLSMKISKFTFIKIYKNCNATIIVNIYIFILLNWFSGLYIFDIINFCQNLIKMGGLEVFCIIACISFFGFVLHGFSLGFAFFFSKSGENKKYREFYECGFKPNTNSLIMPDIQFSLLAIFFLLYDIEIILLAPLFLNIMNSNIFLLFFIWLSILILALSYIYEWESYSFIWTIKMIQIFYLIFQLVSILEKFFVPLPRLNTKNQLINKFKNK